MVVWSHKLSIAFAEISFHWGPKTCPYLHNQVFWGIHPPIYCLHMPKPKFQMYMDSLFSPPPSHEKTPCYFKEVLAYIDHNTFELIPWVPFDYKIVWVFYIDYNLVQCLGLLFLSCMNQLVFLFAIFVCMNKSLSHLLDCTAFFHLKFGHELHEKNEFKNQLIDNAWSRWVLTIWFN